MTDRAASLPGPDSATISPAIVALAFPHHSGTRRDSFQGRPDAIEVDPQQKPWVVVESEEPLGEMARLSLAAEIRKDAAVSQWPYPSDTPPVSSAEPETVETTVHAVPYFAWGNRPGLGMRIWLPTRKARAARSREAIKAE